MTSETQSGTMLYMDFNATTPLAAEVVSDISDSLSQHWANPSSTHAPGRGARRVVDEARAHVASAIGAQPEHVIFTSGGTEANNMVIRGALDFYAATGRRGTPHFITSDIEHDAVSAPVAELERRQLCSVSRLRCWSGGRVDAADLRSAVTPDTCLVSVMHANNETGVLNDIEALARVLAESPYRQHIWFHTDSAQTVGKVEVNAARLGVDFLTVVGHKLYGPRIGALWASPLGLTRLPGGGACVSLLRGGGQEDGLRPGTENTPLVRGLGTACRLVTERLAVDGRRAARLRHLLEVRLMETGVAERINLQCSPRLPNTSSVVLSGRLSGRAVLLRCRRLLASVGSACHEARRAEAAGDCPAATGEAAGDCPAATGEAAGDCPAATGEAAGDCPAATGEAAGDCPAATGEAGGAEGTPGAGRGAEGAPGTGRGAEGAPAAGRGAEGAPAAGRGAEGGPSSVLLRSGVTPADARRTVRLSLGRETTEEDVMAAVDDLRQALQEAQRDEQQKEPGDEGQEPGDEGKEPVDEGKEPGDEGKEPGDEGKEPGDEEVKEPGDEEVKEPGDEVKEPGDEVKEPGEEPVDEEGKF